jgi:hypothetical protein
MPGSRRESGGGREGVPQRGRRDEAVPNNSTETHQVFIVNPDDLGSFKWLIHEVGNDAGLKISGETEGGQRRVLLERTAGAVSRILLQAEEGVILIVKPVVEAGGTQTDPAQTTGPAAAAEAGTTAPANTTEATRATTPAEGAGAAVNEIEVPAGMSAESMQRLVDLITVQVEAQFQARFDQQQAQIDALATEVQELKTERDGLNQRVQQLEQENSRMRAILLRQANGETVPVDELLAAAGDTTQAAATANTQQEREQRIRARMMELTAAVNAAKAGNGEFPHITAAGTDYEITDIAADGTATIRHQESGQEAQAQLRRLVEQELGPVPAATGQEREQGIQRLMNDFAVGDRVLTRTGDHTFEERTITAINGEGDAREAILRLDGAEDITVPLRQLAEILDGFGVVIDDAEPVDEPPVIVRDTPPPPPGRTRRFFNRLRGRPEPEAPATETTVVTTPARTTPPAAPGTTTIYGTPDRPATAGTVVAAPVEAPNTVAVERNRRRLAAGMLLAGVAIGAAGIEILEHWVFNRHGIPSPRAVGADWIWHQPKGAAGKDQILGFFNGHKNGDGNHAFAVERPSDFKWARHWTEHGKAFYSVLNGKGKVILNHVLFKNSGPIIDSQVAEIRKNFPNLQVKAGHLDWKSSADSAWNLHRYATSIFKK